MGAKVYGRAFLPFLEPLSIEKGNRIIIDLSAKLVSNNYIWSWNTDHYNKHSKKPVKSFIQSTFYANPLTTEHFIKRTHNYKTSLNENTRLNLEVLTMFSKNRTVIDIAKSICKKYPKKFKDLNNAIAIVGNLSFKYSE